jgi:hypothetical protein
VTSEERRDRGNERTPDQPATLPYRSGKDPVTRVQKNEVVRGISFILFLAIVITVSFLITMLLIVRTLFQ